MQHANNSFLDADGFSPFALVVAGMDTAVAVFNPTPGSQDGVDQQQYETQGNAWIRQQTTEHTRSTRQRRSERARRACSRAQQPAAAAAAHRVDSLLERSQRRVLRHLVRLDDGRKVIQSLLDSIERPAALNLRNATQAR